MIDQTRMFIRYARGLRGFLRQRLTAEQVQQDLITCHEQREEVFLGLVQRGIFEHPGSPYRRLFEHAGIGFNEVASLVRSDGIEFALQRLYEAGIRVTSNEFKGREPIRRDGREWPVKTEDFDNPLLVPQYTGQTSGSRGAGRRVAIEFALIENDARFFHLMLKAYDLWDRPVLMWRAAPPVTAGISQILRYAKVGVTAERWFATGPMLAELAHLPFWGFMKYTVWASRRAGMPIPMPRYLPLDEAPQVARLLADHVAAGTPAMADTGMSPAIHLCRTASEQGLDLSGTFFRLGGEPFTEGKAKVIRDAGCHGVAPYSMAETGNIAFPCANAAEHDDLHVLIDKIAVFQRRQQVGPGGRHVDALVLTTVAPYCPKLMFNVESDDYGILERRSCNCPIGQLGHDLHLRQIRSYDKLTSNGVAFLGTDLMDLLEQVLPSQFGGGSTDYQLVEQERDGLPQVNLLINPRLGDLDERAVSKAVFAFL